MLGILGLLRLRVGPCLTASVQMGVRASVQTRLRAWVGVRVRVATVTRAC